MSMQAELQFCGGVGTVTGANFLLTTARTRVLVDCGLIQGEKFSHDLNRAPFLYDPHAINSLIVTHAHIDHVGRIPKLVRDGFSGSIYSTRETLDLAKLMLPDAFSVLRSETPEGEELLYGEKDIERAFSLWKTVPYHERSRVGVFDFVLRDSGHILGSAMVEFTAVGGSRKLVVTGDLGNAPTPLLKPAERVADAAYLVMESVYGDRTHEAGEERKQRLSDAISRAAKKKGTLLIPCFSLEKTQVLLFELDSLLGEARIPKIPVFLDSPLAIRVTDVYRAFRKQLNSDVQHELQKGNDPFTFPNLKMTMDAAEGKAIDREPSPKIIIAGSGMSAGGRILEHEQRHLGDPKNTVLFIGYQAVGSLGRQIQDGAKSVRINHEDVRVCARIETISGYSSHMDSDHLLEFAAAGEGTTEKIFVVMGEPKAALFLAQRIRDYLGIKTHVPEVGERVEIEL